MPYEIFSEIVVQAWWIDYCWDMSGQGRNRISSFHNPSFVALSSRITRSLQIAPRPLGIRKRQESVNREKEVWKNGRWAERGSTRIGRRRWVLKGQSRLCCCQTVTLNELAFLKAFMPTQMIYQNSLSYRHPLHTNTHTDTHKPQKERGHEVSPYHLCRSQRLTWSISPSLPARLVAAQR